MDISSSTSVLGVKLANEQAKVQGESVISLVAQAKATGDAARAQSAQNAPSTKAATPANIGNAVDISA